jgi:metal-responsive CopG/Arc/MetJ family transcriptional regulator
MQMSRQKKGVDTEAITCTLPRDLVQEIDIRAYLEGVTRSRFITDALRTALQKGPSQRSVKQRKAKPEV